MNTDPSLRQPMPASAPPSPKLRPETRPFCLRFTHEERTKLEEAAGSVPLGTFIRGLILGSEGKPRKGRQRHPVKDYEALGRILGALGQSHLTNDLKELVKAVQLGTLQVSPETENQLTAACAAVALMRVDLMRGLGLIIQEDT